MSHRPATQADIAAFYGEARVPVEMVVIGEAAIGGLCWLDDGVYAVSWIKRPVSPKQLMRAAHAVRSMIEQAGVQVYATRDPDEPSADRFLRHLGFEPCGDRYAYVRHAEPAARPVPADGRRVRGHAGAGAAA
jgi:hypothetical protein